VFAVIIVGASLWYTNILINKIAREERSKVHTWAEAVQKKQAWLNIPENFSKS